MAPALSPEPDPRIAVIVPVLNEADNIDGLLDDLAGQGFSTVVVVDGGSTDATAARVAAHPRATLIPTQRGRGVQLAAGVAACDAEILLFLHADTRLPPGARDAVAGALAIPGVAAGSFRLRFDAPDRLLALYAAFSRFETGLTTFGDQAMFVHRSALEAVGGVPPWPFLEDVELRRRLRRVGRFVKLRQSVTTSARRFQAEGALRRQALNLLILLLYQLGISPSRLAPLYSARPSVADTPRTKRRRLTKS